MAQHLHLHLDCLQLTSKKVDSLYYIQMMIGSGHSNDDRKCTLSPSNAILLHVCDVKYVNVVISTLIRWMVVRGDFALVTLLW